MTAGAPAPASRPDRHRARVGRTALVIAAWMALAAGAPPARAAAPELERLYDQFASLRPDSSRVAEVTSLLLERDAGVIVLEQGRLTLCAPVGDRVCAAIFAGHGAFAFTPRAAVERGQLERVFGATTLRRTFSSAVLVFADSTLEELSAGQTFQPGSPGVEALKLLRATARSLTFERARDVDVPIARALLEERGDGMFFAVFSSSGADPVGFELDPRLTEPVLLLRPMRPEGSGLLEPARFEIVCQTRRGDDTTSVATGDDRPSVAIRRLALDCTITGKPAFSVRADLDLEVLEAGRRWLPLRLDPALRVESAAWGDGRPAGFRKGEMSPTLWIHCDPPLEAGQHATLRLRYDGPVLERTGDWFGFRAAESATGWYPSHGPRADAIFDLTFHVTDPLQLVAVGERVSSATRDRVTTTHWVTPVPARAASFDVGFFKPFEVRDERIPPVTVLMSSRGHGALTDSLAEEGDAPGQGMEKQVAADVANSLLFFQSRFGRAAADRFCATEVLDPAGAPIPGLIHLSTETFHRPSPDRADALVRAREVARQWWGVGIAPASYREQWLSEAFAEFSALLYIQYAARDSRRYLERLEDTRREILGNRHYVLGSGQPAGPIGLGARNATSSTARDVDLIVVEKGAWVLHMLRNMLLDLETGDETRFNALLRDYYQTYRGVDARTGDFQRLAEQHGGQDLGWFFDQWVRGTDIPAYRFAWRSERTSDTTWTVHGRVEQRGVPEAFRMPVPVRLEFAGDKLARTRVWIQGGRAEFDLPGLPLEPKKVVFNDMASVLCEVENVKW